MTKATQGPYRTKCPNGDNCLQVACANGHCIEQVVEAEMRKTQPVVNERLSGPVRKQGVSNENTK